MAFINIEDYVIDPTTGRPRSTSGNASLPVARTTNIGQGTAVPKPAPYSGTSGSGTSSSGGITPTQNLAYQQQLNRYALQKDQLRRAYELALGQYGEQEGESRASAESLGRQAYRAKMGTERTSENVSAGAGLQGSGYEQLAQQKTQETYQGQYEGIMADYQNALNAIRRSRESEKLQYEQNLQNIDLGITEENQNYALQSQETVKSLTEKASASEGYTNTRASVLNLKDSTSVTNAVKKAVANNLITQEEGTKIVDEWKSINLK